MCHAKTAARGPLGNAVGIMNMCVDCQLTGVEKWELVGYKKVLAPADI
jgi:hypothetical protein